MNRDTGSHLALGKIFVAALNSWIMDKKATEQEKITLRQFIIHLMKIFGHLLLKKEKI